MSSFWINVLKKLCCKKENEGQNNRVGAYSSSTPIKNGNNQVISSQSSKSTRKSRSQKKKKRRLQMQVDDLGEDKNIVDNIGYTERGQSLIKPSYKRHSSRHKMLKAKPKLVENTYNRMAKAVHPQEVDMLDEHEGFYAMNEAVEYEDQSDDICDFVTKSLLKRRHNVSSEVNMLDNSLKSFEYSTTQHVLKDDNSKLSILTNERFATPTRPERVGTHDQSMSEYCNIQRRKQKSEREELDSIPNDWKRGSELVNIISYDSSRITMNNGTDRSLMVDQYKNGTISEMSLGIFKARPKLKLHP